jgi:hypothetical protein
MVIKLKYMGMSRDRNAGRSQNTKIENGSFETVEEFKYLGTTFIIIIYLSWSWATC